MPQFTNPLGPEGLELLVRVGLRSQDMQLLHAGGKPIPSPPTVTGIIDTGSNNCCISARVAGLLGLSPLGQGTTQTAGGPVRANLYKVSLFIPLPGSTTEFLTAADSWTVSELNPAVTGFKAIIGRDLLARLLLVMNGPRNEFILAG